VAVAEAPAHKATQSGDSHPVLAPVSRSRCSFRRGRPILPANVATKRRRGRTDHGRATLAFCRGSTAISLTLAAVGAVVAALFDTTIAPYLQIGGAQPDLVLILAVIWTVVVGIEGGLVWAFLGGLLIDLLAPRPLGSTAFALLLSVGAAAVYARVVVRGRYARPIAAVFLISLVNAVIFTIVNRALRGAIPLDDAVATWLPGAVYNAVLALLIAPILVSINARRADRDRLDW